MPNALTLFVMASLLLPMQAIEWPPMAPPDQITAGLASLEDANLARGA